MSFEARTLTAENAAELAEWCGGRLVTEIDALNHSATSPGINVPCGDEVERASVGDTILRNSHGHFQVLKN